MQKLNKIISNNKKVFNKISKYCKENKRKVIMTVVLIMAVFVVLLNTSFGYFNKRIEGTKLTFNVGTLNYELDCINLAGCEITIPSNQSKTFNVNLTSLNKIDTKYELFYEIISPTNTKNVIDGGHLLTENSSDIGIITKNSTKNIALVANNTGSDEVTIKLGVVPSLKSDNATLEENQISMNKELSQFYYVYNFTENYDTFIAPANGYYKLEGWGAQGGHAKYSTQYYGGPGAYTSGIIYLEKDTEIYVYVGGQGANVTGTSSASVAANGKGYNGGGPANFYSSNSTGGGGGGATDFRLTSGEWSNTESLASRIMVASGGGGSKSHATAPNYSGNGGIGGDLTGGNANTASSTCYAYGLGGTQTSGGKVQTCTSDGRADSAVSMFGNGWPTISSYYLSGNTYAGGGGGYYGGGRGHHAPGAGGSSYISGHSGAIAITSQTDITPKSGCSNGTTDISCSYHYSNKIFTNTIMKTGGDTIQTPDLNSQQRGNEGNGYARITLMDEREKTGLIVTSQDKTGYYYKIPANSSKEIDLTLINTKEASTYYELYYEVVNSNGTENKVEGGYVKSTSNPVKALIEGNASKNMTVAINNSGNDTIYIKIDAKKLENMDDNKITNPEVSLNVEYIQKHFVYDYTGDYQTFIAPINGNYEIEAWGAQGTGTGYGAYTKGRIYLEKNNTLYVYVGGKANTSQNIKTFNNGTSSSGGYNGGGSTDIRLTSGAWDNFDSIKSRIMVAGAGGSASGSVNGAAAGGLNGYSAGTAGGTQTTFGSTQYVQSSFGIANGGCTGGNGYYPGAGATCASGAGGGSSFISGHEGCNAISESSTSSKITHTNQANHYSGYIFIDTLMIDGKGYKWTTQIGEKTNMPTHDLTSTMVGNTGNGYSRITYKGNDSYKVKYDANGGTGDMVDSEFAIDFTKPLSKNTYKKEGYVFAGWSTSKNGKITYTDEEKIKNIANKDETIILYAVWKDGYEYVYNDNETYYTFTAPKTGIYKIDLWGASGGYEVSNYSLGGYTSGEIELEKDKKIYVYVGEKGKNNGVSTFNGGGRGGYGNAGSPVPSSISGDTGYYGYSGGGATDIRLISGEWNSFDSLKSRIMVAAGGAGSSTITYSSAGQNSTAGGLSGYNGGYYSGHGDQGAYGVGGSQTSGGKAGVNVYTSYGTNLPGSFGNGGSSSSYSSNLLGAGGGGGGYYGGGSGGATGSGGAGHGAGGGSSFISGHTGCNAISETSTSTSISHTGQASHYSGYTFTNTIMVDGSGYRWTSSKGDLTKMPTYDFTSTMIGNSGNGHARIMLITEDYYTIKYNANGGTGTMENSRGYIDKSLKLRDNSFAKEGHLFIGWSLSPDSDEVAYKNMESIINLTEKDKTITLYAVWIDKYMVTFDVNGGDSLTETSKIVNVSSAYGTLPTPTRNGYDFIGWYTKAAGGTQITEDTIVTELTETLYAQWKSKTLDVLAYLGISSISRTGDNYTWKSSSFDITDYSTLTVSSSYSKGVADSSWNSSWGTNPVPTAYLVTSSGNINILSSRTVDISGYTGSAYIAVYTSTSKLSGFDPSKPYDEWGEKNSQWTVSSSYKMTSLVLKN